MYGVLDLTWYPTANDPTPPAGKASRIVRGDTYSHVIAFWNDEEETDPFAITGDVTAQIRVARLTSATGGDPIADFAVVVSGAGNNIVTISLTPAQTLALPARMADENYFWDLQSDDGGTITTLLAGKVKVLNDVTREAV